MIVARYLLISVISFKKPDGTKPLRGSPLSGRPNRVGLLSLFHEMGTSCALVCADIGFRSESVSSDCLAKFDIAPDGYAFFVRSTRKGNQTGIVEMDKPVGTDILF